MFYALLSSVYRLLNRFLTVDITHVLLLEKKAASFPIAETEFTLKYLTPDDILSLSANPANDINPQLAEDSCNHGLTCIAYLDRGQLVAYTLTGAVHIESRHNSGGNQFHGIGVALPPGARFLFKSYVLPAYRGRRLHAALVQAALRHPDNGNVVALITTTGLTNRAFLNSAVKLGFKRRGLAIEWVLNGRHRYMLPAPIGINTIAGAIAMPAGEQHYIRFFSGHSCSSASSL